MTTVSNIKIPYYRCPSTTLPEIHNTANNGTTPMMFTTYVGISGSVLDPCSNGGAGLVSGGGVLFPNSKVTITGITDGASNTMVVAEQSDFLRDPNNSPHPAGWGARTSAGPHGWTMGCASPLNTLPPSWRQNATSNDDNRAFNCVTVRYMINQRIAVDSPGTHDNTGANMPITSAHSGGANVLFGDGRVQFLSSSTPLLNLQYLASRADGQVVPLPD